MAKIRKRDFDYYKSIVLEDKQEHRRQLMHKNLPDRVISAYEGFLFDKDFEDNLNRADTLSHVQPYDGQNIYDHADNIIENWLFIAANTIIPGLYYQQPRPNIRPRPNGSSFSAEILNGTLQHFFDVKAKVENQRAIIDAYLPYGLGIMKVGYNSRVGLMKNKRSNLFTGEIKADGKDIDMESSVEYVKYERPFVERVSPRNCYLDWTKEFGKGQRVTFRYSRTLQEITDSNLYTLSSGFVQHFKARNNDSRKVKIELKEMWIILNGFAHKLVWTEEWDEALAWSKTPYQWLPISLLRFNQPSDILYPRSHGSHATSAQNETNYLNSLWKEAIDNVRDQTFVDMSGLTENGAKELKMNAFRKGIVECNRPPAGVAQNVQSGPMSSDIFSNIENVRGYLQQILSAGGAISGDVSADTATQERNVQLGNFLRTSGMKDAIRDFNIDQIMKMTTCMVNFGDPEVTVTITGKDITDPETGEIATGKDVVLGGNRGLSLKQTIIGNIESDYLYDMDMTDSVRPDYAVIRKQLQEYGLFLAEVEPKLNAQGKKVNWSEITKGVAKTFDTIPNVDVIVEDMTEEEQASFQESQALQETQETLKGASRPTEEAIIRGAESTGVAEGLT